MSESETNAVPVPAPVRAPEGPAELEIEKLVYGGSGLSRLDGRVVLTPFVLPGERVRVEIAAERPGLLEAALTEVLTASALRADPPCPYFYRCGGCHYQHAGYETQLEQKRAILAETLRRVGKFEPACAIDTLSAEPWGYRNRAQFHLEGGRIGFFGLGSHELVPVEQCPISSPRLNVALSALSAMMRDHRWPRFVSSLEVFTNETDVQVNVRDSAQPVAKRFFEWCAERIPGFVPGAIEYSAAGESYTVSGASFFQVNRLLVEPLISRALEDAAGETALDLYCGVGLFTLPLARRIAQVAAVESGGSAVRDLELNADRAGLPVDVHRSAVDAFLDNLERAPDFVLADPPRAGLGKYAVRELLRLQPPRLTIVSCDPATLARDLAALLAGGYRLERLTLVDLFPQTYHIETVATLRR